MLPSFLVSALRRPWTCRVLLRRSPLFLFSLPRHSRLTTGAGRGSSLRGIVVTRAADVVSTAERSIDRSIDRAAFCSQNYF